MTSVYILVVILGSQQFVEQADQGICSSIFWKDSSLEVDSVLHCHF